MISISQAYSNYRYSEPSEQVLDQFARLSLQVATRLSRETLPFAVEIGVSAEAGSLKLKTTLAAALSAVVFYGDIRESIDRIVEDGRYVSRMINEAVNADPRLTRRTPIRVMRRTLIAGRLQRLFESVEQGRLTVEQATQAALDELSITEEPRVVSLLASPLYEEFFAAATGAAPRYDVERLRASLERALDEAGLGLRLIDQPSISLSQSDFLAFPSEDSHPEDSHKQLPSPGVFLHREWHAAEEVHRLLLRPRRDRPP